MKTGVGFSLPAESSGTQARALRLFLLNHWRGFKRCRRTKENSLPLLELFPFPGSRKSEDKGQKQRLFSPQLIYTLGDRVGWGCF